MKVEIEKIEELQPRIKTWRVTGKKNTSERRKDSEKSKDTTSKRER